MGAPLTPHRSYFLTSSNPSDPGYACNSVLSSLLESVYLTSTAGNDPISGGASFTSINPKLGAQLVTADVIQVQWQNKDSKVASLMAQKKTGVGNGSATGAKAAPIASPTSIIRGASGGISTGAKIGIGVAVPIFVLSLLATAAVLIWRKRKQRTIEADDTERFHELSLEEQKHPDGAAAQREPAGEAKAVHELSSEEFTYQEDPNWDKPTMESGIPQEVEAREWNELPADAPMAKLSGQ